MTQQLLARPHSENGTSLLAAHLLEVRSLIRDELPSGSDLQAVGMIMGALHDWGKATTYFQSYIRDEKGTQYSKREQEMQRHSLASAYATMYVVDECGYDTELAVAAFLSVARHHGVLKNTSEDRKMYGDANDHTCLEGVQRVLDKTQNVVDTTDGVGCVLLQNAALGETVSTHGLQKYIRSQRPLQLLNTNNSPVVDTPPYEQSLQLYSSLTFADKHSSAGLPNNSNDTPSFSVNELDKHIASLDTPNSGILSDVNTLRENAREEAIEFIRNNTTEDVSGELYSLTLPTGFGKTYTGISAALTRINNRDGRVIYALPFTSIIDQIDSEIQTVFNVSPTDPEYTVHHHLAETRSTDRDTELTRETQQLLGETWRAEFVLTTFVQLFESLAGPRNRESLKLPALRNSTIVLDEPQSLPPRWWAFVARIATVLIEDYNSDVIMMTATQPKIFENTSFTHTPTPIVPDTQAASFEFLNQNPRVRFHLHESIKDSLGTSETEVVSHETAAGQLSNDTSDSVLAVCNTIKSTTTLAEELKGKLSKTTSLNEILECVYQQHGSSIARLDELVNVIVDTVTKTSLQPEEEQPVVVCTLTTRLRPIDRKILLAALRELLETSSSVQLYVLSTQLIEAGVDISFDALYRDEAPIASIVQAAGRCNREFGGDTSRVTIWRLDAPGEGVIIPSRCVYTQPYDLLQATTATFESIYSRRSTTVLPEGVFIREGTIEYYSELYAASGVGSQNSLSDAVDQSRYQDLRADSMIDDGFERVDVFIAVTSTEVGLFEQYCRLNVAYEFKKKNALFDAFSSRICSIPVSSGALQSASLVKFPDKENVFFLNATEYPRQFLFDSAKGIQPATISDRIFV